jgi:hypothetical protein
VSYGLPYRVSICDVSPHTGLCDPDVVADPLVAWSIPVSSGGLVAWVEFVQTGPKPLYVCVLDPETGACPRLEVAVGVDDIRPQLARDLLVWTAWRPGELGDVYFCEYDRVLDVCPVQQLTGHAASQRRAATDGRWIVWEDDRLGTQQIFGYRMPKISTPKPRRVREGALLRINIRARSFDDDGLALAAVHAAGPSLESLGASFRDFGGRPRRPGPGPVRHRGELRWRPAEGQAGEYAITFSGTTGGGVVTRETIRIVVEPRRSGGGRR